MQAPPRSPLRYWYCVAGALALGLLLVWAWYSGGLGGGDQGLAQQLIRWLESLGPWTAVASFLVLVLEVVVAPIPIGVAVVVANGHLFGLWGGMALSWGANLFGSLLTFALARRWARPFVLNRLRAEHAAAVLRLGTRSGFRWLLLARLFPLTPADLLGYLAGLSGMSPWSFALATGLSTIPSLLFYSAIGAQAEDLARYARSAGWVAAIAVAALLAVLYGKKWGRVVRQWWKRVRQQPDP